MSPGVYSPEHRAAVIDLARRCLLPEDAAEAEAIVATATHAPIGVVSEVDGQVAGVALASVGHKDPTAGHLDLLLVDPRHRRRGMARDLLTAVEGRLKQHGLKSIKVAGNPPDYAWPGVDVRYTAAVCALTASGYNHERTAWNMTAPLPPPPPGDPEPGVEIRRATPADLPVLLPMINGEWGPAWQVEVERAVTGEGGVHVAWRAGQPVAFAAWGGCRPGWFGPMGTLPAATGLGLGRILLRHCLADQAARGLASAQIGWVGPVRFYSNAVDAHIERVFFLFAKEI